MKSPEVGLVVVTPWYPSADSPYHGIFVREIVAALRWPPEHVLVVHMKNVMPDRYEPPTRTPTDVANLLTISVPIEPGTPRVDVAVVHRNALGSAMPEELTNAPVVHAHTGMPSGWAVSGLLPDTTRLVTTEHATYLSEVLRTPTAAAQYRQVLQRSYRLLTAGEDDARTLRRIFPEFAHRVAAIGNPISETRFESRTDSPNRFDRWLYVGNLIPRKRVDRVIRAFGLWARRNPGRATSLKIIGEGSEQRALARLAQRLSLGDLVDFVGAVDHELLPAIFSESDVLVHLSSHETFGITVVEAAMTGLPVVVTECGGPEETLASAAREGLVNFVAVNARVAAVVAAVEELEERSLHADRAKVRRELVEQYGDRHFGTRLEMVLLGLPRSEVTSARAVRVLGVSLAPMSARRLAYAIGEIHRNGGQCLVLTDQAGEAAAPARDIAVIDLYPQARRSPIRLVENTLTRILPSLVLRGVRKVCQTVAGVPGPHVRLARRGVNAANLFLFEMDTVADAIHTRFTHPLIHSRTSTRRIVRHLRRHFDEVKGFRPQVIVMGDQPADAVIQTLGECLPGVPVIDLNDDSAMIDLIDAVRDASTGSEHEHV